MKLIALAGSSRKDSMNVKLIKACVDMIKTDKLDVEFVDLADYPMPLYNGDEESANGLPQSALELKEKITNAQGLLIASPEYNGSLSPLLKNTIYWISRPVDGKGGAKDVFGNKVAGIMAASPGGLGGMRGLFHLRDILSGIGCTVLGQQVAVGSFFKVYNEETKSLEDPIKGRVQSMLDLLVDATVKLHS